MALNQHVETPKEYCHSSGPQLTRCVLSVTNGAFKLALATVDHFKS